MEYLNLSDLVDAYAEIHGVSKAKARRDIENVTGLIADCLADGYSVRVPNFFSFIVKETKERQGFNPKQRVPITIPAGRSVKAKPSMALKQRVKSAKEEG